MRSLAAVSLVALALSGVAAAKAPPTGVKLCGTDGCTTIDAQAAEHLFTQSGTSAAPPRPAPFFRLRWTWDSSQEETGAYWLPDQHALRFSGWAVADATATTMLTAAAAGLQPFPVGPPTTVLVGARAAAAPATYKRLLDEGSRVSSWVGAFDWIPVKLASSEPSPWTDGSYDLRISKRSGFVWREGAVYGIPLALARLARAAKSLAPTPSPRGFAPLGGAGCAPASPRRAGEAFGTATGTRLWALFFLPVASSFAPATDARLVGVVGKEVKIVVRFGAAALGPAAIGPDGTRIKPDWGPTVHGWSNWKRPGSEWGVGYTFQEPGCWRIHAGDGIVAGDLWLDVES